MSLRSRLIALVLILIGTSVLIGLGTWQVQRLSWKNALHEQIRIRVKSDPLPLTEIEARWSDNSDIDYLPVELSGLFQHEHAQYMLATQKGASGWHVYTPLVLEDGRTIMVNRGFVPYALRDPRERPSSLVEGTQDLTGLARNPVYEKPNWFVPDNEPANQTFFWKDLGQMAVSAGLEPDSLLPFFVDESTPQRDTDYPLANTTILRFPNNHLQYAMTWYGLALAMAGVGGYFLLSTSRRRS